MSSKALKGQSHKNATFEHARCCCIGGVVVKWSVTLPLQIARPGLESQSGASLHRVV